MTTCTLTLLRRDTVAEGTTAFHFAKPRGFDFVAGQYVDMSLIAPREQDPAGNLRSFSIASAPGDDELVFATRMRATPFKRELAALPEGSAVSIAGPSGDLVLDDDPRPVVLVAGGIGITPFRSMLRDAAHRASGRDITLIYGNRTPQACAFMTELDGLRARLAGLRVVHCMSEPEQAQPPWTGERGFITEKLLARHVADASEPVFYVVGPPAMTAAMRDTLMNFGVDEEAVRVEEFAGY
ncbi:MAG TPA: FAD-dependent oxidoreductase [Casimicrobiaceae bacterium]|nr:FAD-dependent oxidoreductase [Casimicrobiaceae bacterium]